MNLSKAKELILNYKILTWSKDPDKYKIRQAHEELKNEIRIKCSPSFRGSFGMGGKQNRRQRQHVKEGGSLYRDGFHWKIAENY